METGFSIPSISMMHGDYSVLPTISRARAKIISDLDRGSARRDHGLFRIEGWRTLASAVKAGAELEEIVVRVDALSPDRIDLLRSAKVRHVASVGAKGMSKLTSVLQDQGVVATARIQARALSDAFEARHVLALDGVQDPGNVGTLIRSAAWFGIAAVIAGGDTADFYNPKVVRASAGAVWDVNLIASADLALDLGELKSRGFVCFGADLGGIDKPDWHEAEKSVLVVGSEGHGISKGVRTKLDALVQLQGRRRSRSGVESLNAAIAGSILISRWVE